MFEDVGIKEIELQCGRLMVVLADRDHTVFTLKHKPGLLLNASLHRITYPLVKNPLRIAHSGEFLNFLTSKRIIYRKRMASFCDFAGTPAVRQKWRETSQEILLSSHRGFARLTQLQAVKDFWWQRQTLRLQWWDIIWTANSAILCTQWSSLLKPSLSICKEFSQFSPLKRKMVKASCGFGHALFIDVLGFAFAWGSNTYGQLGMGDIFFRSNVELISHVKAVRTKCVAAF